MELRHFTYFVTVAEEEHFGRAAKRLHISQSPLSRQIAQLEAEIGVELFTPAGRGVKLTPAGRTFLEGARAVLARVSHAITDARDVANGLAGLVTIGFEGGSAYGGGLPEAVAIFRKQHPNLKLRLVPMTGTEQFAALRTGAILLGYGYFAPDDDPEIRSQILFRDPMAVVLPKDHRLTKQRSVSVADLAGEPIIFLPREDNPFLYDEMLVAFRNRGVALNIVQTEHDGEAMMTLVASGAGLTFTVESTEDMFRGPAVVRRIRDLHVVMNGRALWHVRDEKSPILRSVRAILAAAHAPKAKRKTTPR